MEQRHYPRMRTNRADINRIFGMFAGLQELEHAAQEMEARFRLIPNGWRNLKLIISVLDKLMTDVVSTVPAEKLVSMNRMLPRMHFKLSCGPQASEGVEECTITLDDANVLSTFAHEHCKLCFDGDCNRCPLGKTLDAVMTYDRDGLSWSSVDLAAIREEYREEDETNGQPV